MRQFIPLPAARRGSRRLGFELIALLLLALTIAALVFEDTLLEKRLRLVPDAGRGAVGYVYSDRQIGGRSDADAVSGRPAAWQCELRSGVADPYCGYELLFDPERYVRGLDLSGYSTVDVELTYRGPSAKMRLLMKNYDPLYGRPGQSDSAKYNQIEFEHRGGTAGKTLALPDFTVAEWWLVKNRIPPELSRPDFHNVIALSVHTGTGAPPGRYAFDVAAITLNGRRLGAAQWYLGILAGWGALLAIYLLYRLAHLREELAARERADAREKLVQDQMIYVSRVNAMGEMGSALAHELNQPLAAVTNYMSVARRLVQRGREGDVDRAVEAISAAEETALRAADIIRHLREMVRGNVVRQPESLAEMIAKIASIALLEADLKGVSHRIDVHDPGRHVLVDRIQIQQVLLNLIRNAVEAMGEQLVRTLIVETADAPDDMVEIRVSDTGPGIPADQQAELFTAFRTTKKEGMGIGLSICRTIVETHGGRIWAEDRASGGTVFRFTVPAAQPEQS